MSTTDESTAAGDVAGASPPPTRRSGWVKAKRYGPIVVVVALIGAAVLMFGGSGGDDSDDEAPADAAIASEDELMASGPMTWQKAEQEGDAASIDWGPGCDTETGRIKLVSVYAPPCVEPFEGDNGGATSPGVTADTVKIVPAGRCPWHPGVHLCAVRSDAPVLRRRAGQAVPDGGRLRDPVRCGRRPRRGRRLPAP